MAIFCLTGPESTGKTTLCKALSNYFHGMWIPEYARDYVENLGRKYHYNDVCHIARKQIEQLEQAKKVDSSFIFFDTDLIITKVWFELCFEKIPLFVTDYLKKSPVDCYLLCFPDIEWQRDAVRENGTAQQRQNLFDRYKQEIEILGKSYFVIEGQGTTRLQNAINKVQLFF